MDSVPPTTPETIPIHILKIGSSLAERDVWSIRRVPRWKRPHNGGRGVRQFEHHQFKIVIYVLSATNNP